MNQITATYSPEDNKIRLYASERLDAETFAEVKDTGFKWAPRQELFVAPKWSTKREDLAIKLAGSIEPEEMTLAERAEMKAERLEGLAHKRAAEAGAYQRRASEISERFAMGQPILVGHHSERKARKDAEKMKAAASKATAAHDAVGYWLYRADGVERHANYKNDPRTRARRIKTLLADLRSFQRDLNAMRKRLAMWKACTTTELIKAMLGSAHGGINLYYAVEKGEVTPEDARKGSIARLESILDGDYYPRNIAHLLNRLGSERELLGGVPRYEGDLTPVILQGFLRAHGADKPKADRVDDDLFTVVSPVDLPAHIGDGESLEMSADEWRDLMQDCGYTVADKAPAKPPILNFSSPTGFIHLKSRATFRGAPAVDVLRVVKITKAEYSAMHTDYRGVRYSACGQFRVKWGRDPHDAKGGWRSGWVAFFITDQKTHPAPDTAEFAEPVEGVTA